MKQWRLLDWIYILRYTAALCFHTTVELFFFTLEIKSELQTRQEKPEYFVTFKIAPYLHEKKKIFRLHKEEHTVEAFELKLAGSVFFFFFW